MLARCEDINDLFICGTFDFDGIKWKEDALQEIIRLEQHLIDNPNNLCYWLKSQDEVKILSINVRRLNIPFKYIY